MKITHPSVLPAVFSEDVRSLVQRTITWSDRNHSLSDDLATRLSPAHWKSGIRCIDRRPLVADSPQGPLDAASLPGGSVGFIFALIALTKYQSLEACWEQTVQFHQTVGLNPLFHADDGHDSVIEGCGFIGAMHRVFDLILGHSGSFPYRLYGIRPVAHALPLWAQEMPQVTMEVLAHDEKHHSFLLLNEHQSYTLLPSKRSSLFYVADAWVFKTESFLKAIRPVLPSALEDEDIIRFSYALIFATAEALGVLKRDANDQITNLVVTGPATW